MGKTKSITSNKCACVLCLQCYLNDINIVFTFSTSIALRPTSKIHITTPTKCKTVLTACCSKHKSMIIYFIMALLLIISLFMWQAVWIK